MRAQYLTNLIFIVSAGLFIQACTNNSATISTPTESQNAATAANTPETEADLVERGRKSYMANCTACHNMNPKLDGSIGPSVSGSSIELLEARILHAKYPEGYTPKRPSKAMAALPHLKNDIPALHAFLNMNPL